MSIGEMTKTALRISKGNFGYSQLARWLGLKGSRLVEPGSFDCSSACGTIAYLGGMIDRKVLSGTFWTGNFAQKLIATGVFYGVNVKGKSLSHVKKVATEGSFILGPGHVVYSLGDGRVVSFETDERGRSSGGKPGDQTDREGRVRDLYSRSRGWSVVVKPVALATFAGRVLAAYAAGNGKAVDQTLVTFKQRAAWDGPRWAFFVNAWRKWDRGMSLTYDPALLKFPVKDHVFVVLGSALHADGSLSVKMLRRLRLVVTAWQQHPNAKHSHIIVSGGGMSAGKTEADQGKRWLVQHGIPADRIIVEDKSNSTVGNAMNTVPLIVKHKFKYYTLVTDASHIRRASILFLAARVGMELPANKGLGVGTAGFLAFNDYGTAPVKSALPVNDSTRRIVAAGVARVMGVSDHFGDSLSMKWWN